MGGVTFESDNRAISIAIPNDSRQFIDEFDAVVGKQFPNREPTSLTRLYAEALSKDARDFRWSMSRQEVMEFTAWITTAVAENAGGISSAELYLGKDVEGLLKFETKGTVMFSWASTDKTAVGFIIFKSKNGPVESEWVRAVSQSLKVKGPLSEHSPKEKMHKLLDAMEAFRDE